MITTIVCKKDGCSGNEFYIASEDNKLKVTCKECGSAYYFDITNYEFIILSNCSKCSNDVFKVFKDPDRDEVYAKCTKCGAPPERIFVDDDGVQVTYEGKLLNDIRQLLHQFDQRLCSVENKIEGLEKGQELLEESLAYINRYMSE